MFLDAIDFAAMYREQKQQTDFKSKNSFDWDNKAQSMAKSTINSQYVIDFLEKMKINKDDIILDIGCGPGALTIPLAKCVKKVIALDFSKEMLNQLELYAQEEGVTNIETHCIGWDDSWDHLEKPDIIIASRSMEVLDIESALLKLSSYAKRTCYLTYKVGGSFIDPAILHFIEKSIIYKPDFIYIPLILYSHNYLPKIDYIATETASVRYTNEDEFIKSLLWSVGNLSEYQINKAREYYALHIKDNHNSIKPVYWSFISWETNVQCN